MKKLIITDGIIFINTDDNTLWRFGGVGASGPGEIKLMGIGGEQIICKTIPENFVEIKATRLLNNAYLTVKANQLWDMIKLVHSLSPGNETDSDAFTRIRNRFIIEAKEKIFNLLEETDL